MTLGCRAWAVIFNKVALEQDEEKFSGAALIELIHYPGTQGFKAKVLECNFQDFIPDKLRQKQEHSFFIAIFVNQLPTIGFVGFSDSMLWKTIVRCPIHTSMSALKLLSGAGNGLA